MLMRLFTPQFLVVWAFVGSAIAVHFRGKVRLGFWRQITDHSTIMAPYNVLMYLFSAVPNRPILRQETIPELKALRDNWQVIRDEALVLFARGQIKAADKYNDWGFNSFFRTGWKRFYLKWYDAALPSAIANCPKTVELVNAIPTVKGAMFASLPPGGRLVQHRDPYAGSLRYHLGLVVPKTPGECRIFIDGEPYSWREGEDLLFDETYLHYAENTTSDDRIILFCDVERPLRLRVMRWLNHVMEVTVIRASQTENMPGDRVGVLNHLFNGAYRVRRIGKWIKKKSVVAHYTLKWLILGGLLYLIFR